jgi:hypothetical protein
MIGGVEADRPAVRMHLDQQDAELIAHHPKVLVPAEVTAVACAGHSDLPLARATLAVA